MSEVMLKYFTENLRGKDNKLEGPGGESMCTKLTKHSEYLRPDSD